MLEHDTALVVDMSAEIRHYVASTLQRQFGCHEVLLAANGEEALSFLRSGTERIEWVFYDCDLPGMEAEDFLAEVRGHAGSRDAALIMMTRRGDKPTLTHALEAGFDDYLVKPFTLSILVLKVRRIALLRERRNGERLTMHASQEVKIRVGEAQEITAGLLNISHTGCFTRAPLFLCHAARIYQEVDLKLQTEDGATQLQGELVRVEGDRGPEASREHVLAAFHFNALSAENHKVLDRFITTLNRPDA